MNLEHVMRLIGRWAGTVRFFPPDPEARIGIAEEIASMAAGEDQVRWLVARVPKLFREWPGMYEVRAVFCSKFRPRDGVDTYSAAYPDGIPGEKEALLALEPATRLLCGTAEAPMDEEDLRKFHRELLTPILRRQPPQIDREALRRAEEEIAAAKPTLSEAEKIRRIREIEDRLGINKN